MNRGKQDAEEVDPRRDTFIPATGFVQGGFVSDKFGVMTDKYGIIK